MEIPEYDLHKGGMKVDDAIAKLDRVLGLGRGRLFAFVTGYGSSGGTSKIKEAVLAKLAHYRKIGHVRGFIDGEKAGDMFSAEFLSFPNAAEIPLVYKRTANPGVVIVRT
ncbi:MAG: hypothetical protein II909_01855 [Kiritimatiellae bacterium]|nr:hypothetical protein [Kiritimatiellia bacterium]